MYLKIKRNKKVPVIIQKLFCARKLFIGAGGGGRTRTSVTPTDFESVTSANSITPAN